MAKRMILNDLTLFDPLFFAEEVAPNLLQRKSGFASKLQENKSNGMPDDPSDSDHQGRTRTQERQ